jgi:methionine synthase I (cobalamin-dependent)
MVTRGVSMPSFLERLARGPLLFDGAMGTMLHSQGIGLDRCFDELNLPAQDSQAIPTGLYEGRGGR